VKVLYTAAHGGFAAEFAPLGGGAAVCDMLTAEWRRTQPFPLSLFTPDAVNGHDIIGFDTSSYARFSRQFEAASTQAIRNHHPAETVVLVNDIAEGPDFRALHNEGYRLATIWHVDVVAYISAIYCRGLLSPQTLTAIHRKIGAIYPDVLKLIFQKQADCVKYSAAHVVPSPEMKEIILRCYPETDPAKIQVLPWGAPPAQLGTDRRLARKALSIPDDALVLLTLSRLSPEKNQQLLLESLAQWERLPDFPDKPVYALICGGAAYMHGKKHEAQLRQLASGLRRTQVRFPGHVHGEEKRLHFSAADLYVFPSTHESYGLTLMEAFQYGLPALTLDHAGARGIMRPEFGSMTTPQHFLATLRELAGSDLTAKGNAAQAYAAGHSFAAQAAKLASILSRIQS